MNTLHLIVTLIVYFTTNIYCQHNDLKAVAILIRHGDRNAVPMYPEKLNDWHFDRTGDLTPRGCVRMLNHSIILRNHLPQIFDRVPNELRSASVPAPLVVDSLKCFMAGIHGPKRSVSEFAKDPKVIVPKSKGDDSMLNFNRVDCPIRDYQLKHNATFLALYDKYKDLIDELNKNTGENLTATDLMTIIKGRLEPIMNANEVNVKIPDWADEKFLEEAEKLATDEFDFVVNFDFQRALSGVFLQDLITKFENAKSGNNDLAFYVYSSVHTTMGPLMKTIDVWTGFRPAYGEALIFTLNKSNIFKVEYLMKNGILKEYKLPGCNEINDCQLSLFKNSMQKYISLNITEVCQVN